MTSLASFQLLHERLKALDRLVGEQLLHELVEQLHAAWVATVRGTYPTPEAGTRTQYVLYVGPWGQAALRLRYVPNAGGWYAQPVRTQRRRRGVRVSSDRRGGEGGASPRRVRRHLPRLEEAQLVPLRGLYVDRPRQAAPSVKDAAEVEAREARELLG